MHGLTYNAPKRSAESRSDVVPNVCAAQADANLDQGLYIYIYLDVNTALNNGADET